MAITIQQAADTLGVGRTAIYKMVDDGRLSSSPLTPLTNGINEASLINEISKKVSQLSMMIAYQTQYPTGVSSGYCSCGCSSPTKAMFVRGHDERYQQTKAQTAKFFSNDPVLSAIIQQLP